jgi:hypothetical protein
MTIQDLPETNIETRPFARIAWCVAALIASYQLFVPPIVGQADTGDMLRHMLAGGLQYPADFQVEAMRSAWVIDEFRLRPPRFTKDPASVWGEPALTSEALAIYVARAMHSAFGKSPFLDIRFIGLAHLACFLSGLWLCLEAVRAQLGPRAARWVIAATVVVFTDVGYVAYFNSVYGDAANLCYLSLFVGAAGRTIHTRRTRWFVVFAGASVLLLTAKAQNAPLAVPMATLAILLGRHAGLRRRSVALVGLVLVVASAIVFSRGHSAALRHTNVYSSIFTGILPLVEDRQQAMKELGIDARLEKYVGKYFWGTADGPSGDPVFESTFKERTSFAPILAYYARNPWVLWALCLNAGRRAFELRVPYMGNFTRESGQPARSQSQAFSIWSGLKTAAIPQSMWAVLLVLGLAAAGAVGSLVRRSSTEGPLWGAVVLVLVAMAALQFLVSIMGDGMEAVARHLFFFNALWDLLLITIVGIALDAYGQRG